MSKEFNKIGWLFKGCSPAEMDRAQRLCSYPTRTRTYEAYQDVISEKDRSTEVYIILDGTVKVHVTMPVPTKPKQDAKAQEDAKSARKTKLRKKTKQIVLGLRGPGEIIGEMGQVSLKSKRSATVTTVEPCRLLCLEQHIWKQLWEMPCVPRNVAAVLAARLRLCASQIQAMATLDVRGRVASQLVAFAEGCVQNANAQGHIRIPLRLPQEELGDMIGASRAHINKALKLFEEQECIEIDDKQYVTVLDLTCLEKYFLQ